MRGHTIDGGRINHVTIRRRCASPATMDPCEGRRLMSTTVTQWSAASDSVISGANYFAAVEVGGNGDVLGAPTAFAGTGDETQVSSYPTWDLNMDDGLDSGWVPVQFGLNTTGTGGASWTVDGDDPDILTGGTGGPITQVKIQAAVDGPLMEMSWQDVTVSFYKGGTLMETVKLGDIDANTMNATTDSPAESIVTVTPDSAAGYDGVRVTGQVRLASAAGMYPCGSDIFGQVVVS